MPASTVATYGNISKFTTSALMGLGATQQDANGRFFINGSGVNVELSSAIAESIYIKRIFRDGQSVTGKYTTKPERNGAVRVILNTPLPFSSRTASYGGRKGTTGNDGIINVNPAQLPASDEFMVYTNQINDQMMIFPELSREYIPLDIMAAKIAQYTDRVSMDRDASTLAEILAYNIWRSLNGGENLVNTGDLSEENAYATLINETQAKLDNGDAIRGAYTFPTEGRTIIGRPSFINGIFNRKSGVIMLGGDLAQEMLRDYDLNSAIGGKSYVGTGYKGYAMGFHFQTAPDYIWTLAEAYLGLAKGSLNNIKAIAVSYDATAMAEGIDRGVKIVDATSTRGALAQPLNIWGHEAFRKSYIIAADGVSNTTFTTLGFSETSRAYPVAPANAADALGESAPNQITVPVYGTNGDVIGYKVVAEVPNPSGSEKPAAST